MSDKSALTAADCDLAASALAQPDAQAQQPVAWLVQYTDSYGEPVRSVFLHDPSESFKRYPDLTVTPLFLAPQAQTRREVVEHLRTLLELAKCPECDGSDYNARARGDDWEQIQCQWCDERARALAPAIQQGKETK